jgi:hypothetical protein
MKQPTSLQNKLYHAADLHSEEKNKYATVPNYNYF